MNFCRFKYEGLLPWILCVSIFAAVAAPVGDAEAAPGGQAPRFIDHSVLVASDYPCAWPESWPLFQILHYRKIGFLSPYNIDILGLDPNTGTQMDTPPHSIPLEGSGLPYEGPAGVLFTEKIPAWQFGGEACVIDIRELRGKAKPGHSPFVQPEHVKSWEKSHRPLRFGDVALFRSDHSDLYYKPFPEGRKFVAECVEGKITAYPNPHPDTLEYVASKKVMHMGTDSPSMGPLPELANLTHVAGLKHGGIFTEAATRLGELPTTGAFYCMMGPKHVGGAYGEGRAFSIVGDPLARRLIDSVRKKRAVDLSVEMAGNLPVWWPGVGVGRHRQPYYRIDFKYAPSIDYHHNMHLLDSHTGTHLVPPSYALPEKGFDNATYAPEVRTWLAEYEERYGRRGTSDVTTEKVPLSATCGPARVIDVRHLVGSTKKEDWPRSPEITVGDIERAEKRDGPLKSGDVVIFHSGHTDRHFKPFPEGSACLADPLNGQSEGWPSPGPDAIKYLAGKGIRCVATDGPTLGGASPRRALMTYWALGTSGMVGVEFLINVGKIPRGTYFLFAPVRIRDCHGGPGRAIGLY